MLNDAQLGFEAKLRDSRQSHLLRAGRQDVLDDLSAIEGFLNSIVSDWERVASGVVAGADAAPISDLLQPLFRKVCFNSGVGARFDRISKAYNANLFGLGE